MIYNHNLYNINHGNSWICHQLHLYYICTFFLFYNINKTPRKYSISTCCVTLVKDVDIYLNYWKRGTEEASVCCNGEAGLSYSWW